MEILIYSLTGLVVILALTIMNLYRKFSALDDYLDEMDNAINDIDNMYHDLHKLLTEQLQQFN